MAGIYIHLPYCVKKCPYCDFVSYTNPPISFATYIDAICAEIQNRRHEASSITFDTIYIGGGTPSLLPAHLIDRLLSCIAGAFSFSCRWDLVEISIEANPESVSASWLDSIRRSGVNRISIGVQDLSKAGLRSLNRPHGTEDALKALSLVLDRGFHSVNMDMIFGIPGQISKDLETSIEAACATGVDHISYYELTVESGTRLYRYVESGSTVMPDQELLEHMTDLVESMLEMHGFQQYEISNFARPGHECRHNLNYWDNGPYMGLGVSAVSYLNGFRYRNTESLEEYVGLTSKGQSPVTFTEHLDTEASFRETVILGLRTNRGISIERMQERFGINPIQYYKDRGVMEDIIDEGLIIINNDMIRLTRRGRRIANKVLSLLV